jgi:uncharacterized C2H2 Zn-finger protein
VTVSRFDRVRPRTVPGDPAPTHDSEGKRALFSSTDAARPSGSILIECSRCGRVTALTPAAALRTAFPALHLSVAVGHGERETTIGVLRKRRHGSWLRCPACGHGSWVRVTVRV